MLTREVPFKGLEGLQVAWLVVEKNEVRLLFFFLAQIQLIDMKTVLGVCKRLFHLLQIESKFNAYGKITSRS